MVGIFRATVLRLKLKQPPSEAGYNTIIFAIFGQDCDHVVSTEKSTEALTEECEPFCGFTASIEIAGFYL